jgi:hypothetical protein
MTGKRVSSRWSVVTKLFKLLRTLFQRKTTKSKKSSPRYPAWKLKRAVNRTSQKNFIINSVLCKRISRWFNKPFSVKRLKRRDLQNSMSS